MLSESASKFRLLAAPEGAAAASRRRSVSAKANEITSVKTRLADRLRYLLADFIKQDLSQQSQSHKPTIQRLQSKLYILSASHNSKSRLTKKKFLIQKKLIFQKKNFNSKKLIWKN
jgi:hypothetical protein